MLSWNSILFKLAEWTRIYSVQSHWPGNLLFWTCLHIHRNNKIILLCAYAHIINYYCIYYTSTDYINSFTFEPLLITLTPNRILTLKECFFMLQERETILPLYNHSHPLLPLRTFVSNKFRITTVFRPQTQLHKFHIFKHVSINDNDTSILVKRIESQWKQAT